MLLRRLWNITILALISFILAIIIGISGGAFILYISAISFLSDAGKLFQSYIAFIVFLFVIASVTLGFLLSHMLDRGPRTKKNTGGIVLMNNQPTDTQDPQILKMERDSYYRSLSQAKDQITTLEKDLSNIRTQLRQLEDDRKNFVKRGQYDQLQQKYDQLQQRYDQLRKDYDSLQRDNGQLKSNLDRASREYQSTLQSIEQMRQENKQLQWRMGTMRDQVKTLMQQDETRQRENERLRERIQQLQRGGATAGITSAEFQEPEIGDPPDYEQEKQEHNHLKAYPDTGKALALADGWKVIGASRRGRGHEYNHVYRDDDFAVRPFGNNAGVVVAIADGLGSKPFSRWGARAAVHGAIGSIQEDHLDRFAKQITQPRKDLTPEQVRDALSNRNDSARYLISQMLIGARKSVPQVAKQRGKGVDDLHSTLLVFLAIPHDHNFMYIVSAQIGDGAIRSRDQDARWTIQEEPQLNGIDNEVMPFMRFEAERFEELIHVADLEYPTFVVGMTDGTLDDIEGVPDETGMFKNIEDFYKRIEASALTQPEPSHGLLNFLGYRRRASFDDRTLVCLYRQP